MLSSESISCFFSIHAKRLKLHLGFILLLCACSTDPEIVRPSDKYSFDVPYFETGTNVPQPAHNQATKAGVELGKKLFFDPILSGNDQISCATCHLQKLAFSDGVALTNKGISGKTLLRNTPALFNLAWATGYFHDGGAKNLESQVFAPLLHEDEMKEDLDELVKELSGIEEYKIMFKNAFGTDSINTSFIAWAIAQYERSLISASSRYDHWKQNKGEKLSQLEINGMLIYQEKCQKCHQEGFFTDYSYHNNGLDSTFTDMSHERLYTGRYRITDNIEDLGKYKTPSLRNLSFSAPYMHDGRMASLEDVIAHYSSGIKHSATLSKDLPFGGFKFSDEDKKALLAFLKTLDDYDFTTR